MAQGGQIHADRAGGPVQYRCSELQKEHFSRSALPSDKLCGDALARELAEGVKAPQFGLNLQIATNLHRRRESNREIGQFLDAYDRFIEWLRPQLPADGVLLYDAAHLHSTVASPVVFFSATDAYRSLEERTQVERAVLESAAVRMVSDLGDSESADALRAAAASANYDDDSPIEVSCKSATQFTIEVAKPALGRRAAVFLLADPTDRVTQARRSFMAGLRASPAATEAGLLDPDRGGAKAPDDGFVHMTFARITRDLTATEEKQVRTAFAAAASRWQPQPLTVSQLVLMREHVGYMHFDLSSPGACALRVSLDGPQA